MFYRINKKQKCERATNIKNIKIKEVHKGIKQHGSDRETESQHLFIIFKTQMSYLSKIKLFGCSTFENI
jgi:hypothetical protein